MKKSAVLLLVTVFMVLATLVSFAQEISDNEVKQHLVAAHAKWGVIEVILDELYNPEFKGDDGSRSALSYVCRHVSTIAAPALNRWVIRAEKKYLGKELEHELDVKVHQPLEDFDMGIGFCNSPEKSVWNEAAIKMHARIKEGRKNAKRIFKIIPCPRVTLAPELQREVIRDEIRIITAFLVNQDESHRWTPEKEGVSSYRQQEIARVALLHAQVLHITARMIEYVISNKTALTAVQQKKLAEVHACIEKEKKIGMRVIASGDFNWETMHDQFHKVFNRAYNDLEDLRMSM
ncbi:MAG: hypothetical protein CVV41_15015 [Candidatus Riflebacteria bacterium HGW-Riflebacteria-1]|jgi:transposase-like protein|nr:MAG: hypothetical protein CVV41_15015 [Candidatus Riflebacteria bacterium HGW-Riflebacteria-1]